MNSSGLNIFVASIIATGVAGCDFLSMERVPTEKVVRSAMGHFLVKPEQVKGEYQNLDVDSLIFTYVSGAEGEKVFWSLLDEGLKGSRWKRLPGSGFVREYRRSYEKGECCADRPGMAIFSSFEVARIAIDPTTRKVVIAYVQADASPVDTAFERTVEGQWAEKAIWPRFQKLVAELNAQPVAPADRPAPRGGG